VSFDAVLNGRETIRVCLLAKENDIVTRCALVRVFILVVRIYAWWEDNMAGGDQEKVAAVAVFGQEDATSAFSKRCGLGRDRETKRMGERMANIYSHLGGVNRQKKLRTS